MPEYGFSPTRIFLYNDRIADFVLIRKNASDRKTMSFSVISRQFPNLRTLTV